MLQNRRAALIVLCIYAYCEYIMVKFTLEMAHMT